MDENGRNGLYEEGMSRNMGSLGVNLKGSRITKFCGGVE